MVGHVNLEAQVDADFSRARRRMFLRRIGTRLRNGADSGRVPCFDETKRRRGAVSGVRRRRRVVRLTDVVGSVGRCSEFDTSFLPARASVEEKWKRIDRAFRRGEELPPVSLYEITGAHFVLDGHHRVSVYRYHGVEWVDAVVTEFGAPPPSEPTRTRTAERTNEHAKLPTADLMRHARRPEHE